MIKKVCDFRSESILDRSCKINWCRRSMSLSDSFLHRKSRVVSRIWLANNIRRCRQWHHWCVWSRKLSNWRGFCWLRIERRLCRNTRITNYHKNSTKILLWNMRNSWRRRIAVKIKFAGDGGAADNLCAILGKKLVRKYEYLRNLPRQCRLQALNLLRIPILALFEGRIRVLHRLFQELFNRILHFPKILEGKKLKVRDNSRWQKFIFHSIFGPYIMVLKSRDHGEIETWTCTRVDTSRKKFEKYWFLKVVAWG